MLFFYIALSMCPLFTGNTTIKLNEVDSTNKYLAELAEHTRPADGTVVIAEHQTQGKGQRGAVWQAAPKLNLTFSIIYYPAHFAVSKQFQLTQAISLGVHDFLLTYCKQVNIKWPNDLFVSGKKIGGLLIENTIKGENIVQVIVGVGININQKKFNLPKGSYTSLSLENNANYAMPEVLAAVLSCIERRYLQLINAQYIELKKQYMDALYLYQMPHEYYKYDGIKLNGKIIGINDKGLLLIEDQLKNIHQFANKEIIF
jgi:BirA family biotin operon repressor/biotin-[acetyl-CoA-carboxylase] ligase